jgi:hypothetical protein
MANTQRTAAPRPPRPSGLPRPRLDPPAARVGRRRGSSRSRGACTGTSSVSSPTGPLYALKELPPRMARREHDMLRRIAVAGLPVVEASGIVDREQMQGMPGEGLENVLITRYLDYSLPYRVLFTHPPSGARRQRRSAVARASARRAGDVARAIHILGFFWGDCSLSNTLFRRDAGALAAYIVDLETGEWHPELTDGQRRDGPRDHPDQRRRWAHGPPSRARPATRTRPHRDRRAPWGALRGALAELRPRNSSGRRSATRSTRVCAGSTTSDSPSTRSTSTPRATATRCGCA